MPGKVHIKFEDDKPPRAPKRVQIKDEAGRGTDSTRTSVPGEEQMNAMKRSRDGTPKSEHSIPAQRVSTSIAKTELYAKKQKITSIDPSQLPTYKPAQNGRNHNSSNTNQPRRQRPANPELAKELEKKRKLLPIWEKKANIRWALRNNDVLLLNGETGSGKSTQTPQFLYTEPWCNKQTVKIKNKEGRLEEISVGGMIAITQPRRVAAITLAKRVAREMGFFLSKGVDQGLVGYSVRFESVMPQGMKIKFLTEGMLLQEMLRDPYLRRYSAVIVDEIHERSVDVDLIAGFLRQLVHGDKGGRGGLPLKVVIMSATLDLGGLEAFFAKPGTRPNYEPGQNHGKILAPYVLKDKNKGDGDSDQSRRSSTDTFSSWSGISSSDKEQSHVGNGNGASGSDSERIFSSELESGIPDDDIAESGVAVEYVQGRQYDVTVFNDVEPTQDYLQNTFETILKLHTTEPLPGDILAFLTGQEEIDTLQAQLEHFSGKLKKTVPRMKIMPLYGALPAQAQQDAFEKVKETFTRKIVLATNIAETSVTVSGVHFVIDCGKSKVKQYRPRLGMESLLSKPISKTSALQRAGRAGREAPGKCFRLYTEQDHQMLDSDEQPEILRSDVIEAVLKMKARGVEDVLTFPLMDSPEIRAMEIALLQLHVMGALDEEGKLTEVGKKIAAYPLPAAYGRVIIAAADADCLVEAIDVISCLTSDAEVFLQPKSDEEKEASEGPREAISHPRGDILTYLTTMQNYAAENTDRNEWCRKHLISRRAMKMAMAIRKQLRQVCFHQKLLKEQPPSDPQPFEIISEEKAEVLLKTFLKAFATRTALLCGTGYSTTQGHNEIHIHPSSVLFGRKVEAIMFLDNVYTAKNYAKRVSAIQANWILEALEI
jgi:ATP-dependent RNA helicase DHR2